jgi:hypothetical protein
MENGTESRSVIAENIDDESSFSLIIPDSISDASAREAILFTALDLEEKP